MTYLWVATLLIGISLQILVIAALLRGAYREFKILFVYIVALFLTTVVEAAAFFNPQIWSHTSRYYWIADSIRQGLIYCVVIALTYRVMENSRSRSAIQRALVGGAILFTVLSLYFTRDPRFGFWMARVGRNLGFCAVILNLVLWAVLIKYRQANRLLLLISGGLGIQMAGKAIGHSLRQFSQEVHSLIQIAGDLIIVLSHIACLYIWWQAFRTFDRREPER